MASSLCGLDGVSGVLEKDLQQKVLESNILVVGAGGIGCEVLKNLVMTGFKNIDIVSISYNLKLTTFC
jgi:ubiquitin-like 1-activating enzyme E1 B